MKEPIFETQRLKVRPWTDGDAPALFKYASPHKSIDESRSVIKDIFSNGHTWALELKDTGEAIGCIGYYDWKESNIGIGPRYGEMRLQGHWDDQLPELLVPWRREAREDYETRLRAMKPRKKQKKLRITEADCLLANRIFSSGGFSVNLYG